MLTGPVLAAALLLGIAGIAKLARPRGTVAALREAGFPHALLLVQILGFVELCLAAVVIAWAPWPAVALLSLAYLVFAVFSLRLLAQRGSSASCGCFGSAESPVHWVHVATNVVVAGICALAVVRWRPEAVTAAPTTVIAAGAVLAGGLYLMLVALPPVLIATDRELRRATG